MNTLVDLGDGKMLLVIILTELFGGESMCTYSNVRNVKLTALYFIKT